MGLLCPYGAKCSFAHGAHELKPKLIVPVNFKTVKCKQYFDDNICNYGPRCQFLHKTDEDHYVNPLSASYKTILDGLLFSFQKEESTNGIKDMGVFLNKTANPECYGRRKLTIFASLREEF